MATQQATATFTGVEDTVTVTYPAMPGNFGFSLGVNVTAAAPENGPVSADILGAPTSTSAVVRPSARFTGTVTVLIWDKP